MSNTARRQATGGAVARNQIPDERIYMTAYHERGGSTLVFYDLADPEGWGRAGREIESWGKTRTTIHALDADHILVEYRAGGAADIKEHA